MIRTCLFFFLATINVIHTQNSIGLRALATLRGLTLGSEAPVAYLRGDADMGQYISMLKQNIDLIIPASAFMPTHTWMNENQYNFTDTDWLVGSTPNTTGWIQQNRMLVKAHALIWGKDYRVPTWLLEQEASITPAKALSLLSDFIHTIAGRYRGKIYWWNVINEASSDYNHTTAFNLENSFWYRKLGADYIKYAFIFAREADPNVKLFYNEYSIEHGGYKADNTLALLKWLKSEGVSVDGLGMQWHISTTEVITPGDAHYQIAQQFIDLNLLVAITELDVGMKTNGAYPADPNDFIKQAQIYRSMFQYALHFYPNISSVATWGFTDRYSFVSTSSNYTRGNALTLDCQYQPKPAFWEVQEELGRVLADGLYKISPISQPDHCLGTTSNNTNSTLQLYADSCKNTNEQWNVTWQKDGTYRFSPQNTIESALNAYNASITIGQVGTTQWTGDTNQEWVITPKGNDTFRLGPRNAWWRVLTVYNASIIAIVDDRQSDLQYWTLTMI